MAGLTVEERFRQTLEASGARAAGLGSYVLAQSPEGRPIYAVFARGKKNQFSNLTFVTPIRAEPTAAQAFGGALAASIGPGPSLSWLPPVKFFVETDGHRASKARGAIRELQSGIPSFDNQVFVESSARPREVQPLLALPEFCEAVRGVLQADARFVELRSGKGAAAVVWPNHATFADPAVAAQVLGSVGQLAAALPRFESTSGRVRLGPAGFLTYACAIGALTGFIAGVVSSVSWGTATGELGLHAAGAALPCYLVLLLVARFRSRQSSSGTTRFGVIAVTGLLALVGWFVGLANGLNALLDPTVKIHAGILEEKYEASDSKKTNYYARIAPVGPVADSVEVKVDRTTYQRLPAAGAVRVRAGGGWLGYPWVDEVYPAE